jgi:RNA polymerase sigma factor (sigma-70 family)
LRSRDTEPPDDDGHERHETHASLRCRGLDYSAFTRLYELHSGRVHAYLGRKLSNPEEVDEVFQKVFLKLHQTRSRYNPAYPFTQWLFVIAKTACLDHFRRQGRRPATESIEAFGDVFKAELSQDPGSVAFKGEKELTILEDLPPDQRAALEMRVIEEKSYDEIAAALKKTEQNVRQLVSRALRKLRLS